MGGGGGGAEGLAGWCGMSGTGQLGELTLNRFLLFVLSQKLSHLALAETVHPKTGLHGLDGDNRTHLVSHFSMRLYVPSIRVCEIVSHQQHHATIP